MCSLCGLEASSQGANAAEQDMTSELCLRLPLYLPAKLILDFPGLTIVLLSGLHLLGFADNFSQVDDRCLVQRYPPLSHPQHAPLHETKPPDKQATPLVSSQL